MMPRFDFDLRSPLSLDPFVAGHIVCLILPTSTLDADFMKHSTDADLDPIPVNQADGKCPLYPRT